MPKVMGIDPSLASLGLAYRGERGVVTAHALGHKTKKGQDRLVFMRDIVSRYLDLVAPELVAFEGYAIGFNNKNSNNILNLAELGGILKLLIFERGIDILLVPPTSLKLFATGKGNADKDKVRVAIQSDLQVSFSTSDQYDAAGLLVMGEAHLNPVRSLPRDRRHYKHKALKGCVVLAA